MKLVFTIRIWRSASRITIAFERRSKSSESGTRGAGVYNFDLPNRCMLTSPLDWSTSRYLETVARFIPSSRASADIERPRGEWSLRRSMILLNLSWYSFIGAAPQVFRTCIRQEIYTDNWVESVIIFRSRWEIPAGRVLQRPAGRRRHGRRGFRSERPGNRAVPTCQETMFYTPAKSIFN